MVSRVGRAEPFRNGRRAPGLVYFAAALLGRAAGCLLLRTMRRTVEGFSGASQRGALVRKRRRGRMVHAFRGRIAAAGNEMQMRLGALSQRERHSGRVVESGSTSLAVLKNGMWPADAYLE